LFVALNNQSAGTVRRNSISPFQKSEWFILRYILNWFIAYKQTRVRYLRCGNTQILKSKTKTEFFAYKQTRRKVGGSKKVVYSTLVQLGEETQVERIERRWGGWFPARSSLPKPLVRRLADPH
jgi:hypothetical protein